MAVKYKVIERGQPGVAGGGEKKFYASAVSNGELTLEKLTKRIERTSTVGGADIRAVLYSLVENIQDGLEEGAIVRLGELGSLRISIGSNGEETREEVGSNSIKSAKCIFTPGKELKKMQKNLDYVKVE
ncbi:MULTISPECIES: HU family DNA-binding protein [unclassified Saccharicrinis]|uniref:HU family DNA-binding protein n=1 Tax=unclassified Saccharicrinis TaxID=2646859 RepID=UPI003D33EDEC